MHRGLAASVPSACVCAVPLSKLHASCLPHDARALARPLDLTPLHCCCYYLCVPSLCPSALFSKMSSSSASTVKAVAVLKQNDVAGTVQFEQDTKVQKTAITCIAKQYTAAILTHKLTRYMYVYVSGA